MTGLVFEYAPAFKPPSANRNDVVGFVGFVARRRGASLPGGVLAELRQNGWLDGPWQRSDNALESLLQIPVTVESFDEFDRLFAWDQRRLSAGGAAVCASYLGAAVRAFFATGGRRAVIVRTGEPWAYLEPAAQQQASRLGRLQQLLPGTPETHLPIDCLNPGSWLGLQHLYGLPRVAAVCLPDLPELASVAQTPAETQQDRPAAPELFVECSADEPAPPEDQPVSRLTAPRLDGDGFKLWGDCLRRVRGFLRDYRPDALFLGALPLPQREALIQIGLKRFVAESDLLEFLQKLGVLNEPGDFDLGPPATAFSQLAYPWLQTRRSKDLPETLEPPDGLLAGLVAANAMRRGTFRSLAGTLLPTVVEPKPVLDGGIAADSPAQRLAERVCLIAPEPGGIALQADVTTSTDPAWRQGGVRRLFGAVLRAARELGDGLVFEPNGPVLWARVRTAMEGLLTSFWQRGGLGGNTVRDAFSVRCDSSTMTQNDRDAGRVIVEIRLLPVASVEQITLVMKLENGGLATTNLQEVA